MPVTVTVENDTAALSVGYRAVCPNSMPPPRTATVTDLVVDETDQVSADLTREDGSGRMRVAMQFSTGATGLAVVQGTVVIDDPLPPGDPGGGPGMAPNPCGTGAISFTAQTR
ncbi:hypothetical protein [Rhodococcus koreensis]|uniref:hypothetical protein n=1 Tax=Rhodococcus koreensis TaxID=99653 RepID=UPI0036D9FBEE